MSRQWCGMEVKVSREIPAMRPRMQLSWAVRQYLDFDCIHRTNEWMREFFGEEPNVLQLEGKLVMHPLIYEEFLKQVEEPRLQEFDIHGQRGSRQMLVSTGVTSKEAAERMAMGFYGENRMGGGGSNRDVWLDKYAVKEVPESEKPKPVPFKSKWFQPK